MRSCEYFHFLKVKRVFENVELSQSDDLFFPTCQLPISLSSSLSSFSAATKHRFCRCQFAIFILQVYTGSLTHFSLSLAHLICCSLSCSHLLLMLISLASSLAHLSRSSLTHLASSLTHLSSFSFAIFYRGESIKFKIKEQEMKIYKDLSR